MNSLNHRSRSSGDRGELNNGSDGNVVLSSPTTLGAPNGVSSSSAAAAAAAGGSNPAAGGVGSTAAGSNSALLGDDASTSDVEIRVKKAADQSCWSTFVVLSLLVLGLLVVGIWSQWQSSGGAVQTHSLEYFVLCMIGGVLSGLPHFILTPMDQVKCRMQTGEFSSVIDGFKHVWSTAGSAGAVFLDGANGTTGSPLVVKDRDAAGGGAAAAVSIITRISALYRGWAATFIGYSLQGALKMSLYEYFKWSFRAQVGPEAAKQHQVVLFLAASCCAESVADVFLAPWEAVKVKIQTNPQVPAVMSQVVPRMFRLEGLNGFFKGLPPLWMRQVPYTMTKFATFEKTVEYMYLYVLRARKIDVSSPGQLMVSLASGFIAGVFCTLVSHPADTVVSKLNHKVDNRVGAWQVAVDLGCSGLWKGVVARIFFIGTLTAMQWLAYDGFKTFVGLGTSGGGGGAAPVVAATTLPPTDSYSPVGRMHHPR